MHEFWPGIDFAVILHYGWAGLTFATAGDSHLGVAVGTYVWLPHVPAVGGGAGEGSGSGVAKFEVATLEQFLRSHEDTTGVPKCKGLARPVFEMKASQASQGAYALMPGASPGRSALWLFTTKKIEVPGKGFVFLG